MLTHVPTQVFAMSIPTEKKSKCFRIRFKLAISFTHPTENFLNNSSLKNESKSNFSVREVQFPQFNWNKQTSS